MTHAGGHRRSDATRPFPAERGLDVYNKKLGMWVFLASEVMFFAALIGTYVILRFGATGEWAKPGVVLNIKITAFKHVPADLLQRVDGQGIRRPSRTATRRKCASGC